MASNHPSDTHNPWSDQQGQSISQQRTNGNPYDTNSNNSYESNNNNNTQPSYPVHQTLQSQSQYMPPQHPYQEPGSVQNPWAQHPQQSQQTPHSSWDSPTQPLNPQSQALPSQHPSQGPLGITTAPSLPPRTSTADLGLPTGQDRTEQLEAMQSYEAAGHRDEHDHNVEILQREFPALDGSLIAAIYGDSQSLSATREMLGALS